MALSTTADDRLVQRVRAVDEDPFDVDPARASASADVGRPIPGLAHPLTEVRAAPVSPALAIAMAASAHPIARSRT